MKFIKIFTLILAITPCAQAPLQAFWGWGNAQSATDAKSSWTAWFLGGAAVASICAVGYKYLYPKWKQHKINKEFSDTLENPNLRLPVKLQKIIDILPQEPTNLNYQTKPWGNTAIHLAIFASYLQDFNNVEVVQKLTEAKADPNITNYSGDTPLHYLSRYAVAENRESPDQRDPKIVEILVAAKADVHGRGKPNTYTNTLTRETPLAIAALHLSRYQQPVSSIAAIVQKLIDLKADITSVDAKGNTMLQRATAQGWDQFLKTIKKSDLHL